MNTQQKIIDKNILVDLYIKQDKTQEEIAKYFGCHISTIQDRFKKYNISSEDKKSLLLIGRKFNKLLITKKTEQRKHQGIVWECLCDCGRTTFAIYAHLKSGSVKSCGCLANKDFNNINKEKYQTYKEITGYYWGHFSRKAKIRNWELLVDQEYCWDLYLKQDKKCSISKIPIDFKLDPKYRTQSASLDRIDSTKNYTSENVQWVHKDINNIKSNFHQDYFCYMCYLIHNKNILNLPLLDLPFDKKNDYKENLGSLSAYRFNTIKSRAATRNIAFELTIDYLWDLYIKQNGRCALTGIPIYFCLDYKLKPTASLDRIDSNQNYIINNVQWVHKDTNRIKSYFNQDYLKEICNNVALNNTIIDFNLLTPSEEWYNSLFITYDILEKQKKIKKKIKLGNT